jgi:cell division transport system permease protein
MFTSFKRIVKASWHNFLRQKGLTFATCFVLVTAISLVAFLFFLKGAANYAVADLQNKVNISVYFKQDALEDEILKIKAEVEKIPQVQSTNYISKDEALAIFTQAHQDDPLLIESLQELGGNPLLASLSIKSWQIDQYEKISEYFTGVQASGIIEKVDYFQRKTLIERVAAMASAIKVAGILAGIILALIAVLITFNTVRLTILNQKEEIEIQRLVGASNWFIRGPFLVQGALAGLISAFVSLALVAAATWILSSRVAYVFSDINLLGLLSSNIWMLFGIQLGTGILLGTGSSLLAARKYLRV